MLCWDTGHCEPPLGVTGEDGCIPECSGLPGNLPLEQVGTERKATGKVCAQDREGGELGWLLVLILPE